MDFVTQTDILEIGVRKFLSRNESISEDAVRKSGTTTNSLLQAAAAMAGEVMGEVVEAWMNSRIDTATGADLVELVWDFYKIIPKAASPAVTEILLTQSGGKAGTIPAGTIMITDAGVEFRTLDSVTFQNTDATATVDVEAALAGLDGNVAPESISQFKTPPAWDTAMTVYQADWATGGDVPESEADLKTRTKAFWDAARRGIPGAIEYGARTVSGVKTVEVVEQDVYPTGGGIYPMYRAVKLYCSDVNTRLNSTLLARVVTELENWRACGVYVAVLGGTVVYQNINISISFTPNADTVTAKAAASAAIFAYMNELGYEEGMYRKAIEDRVMQIPGIAKNPRPVISLPAGDVVPIVGSGQILKTREDLISINRRV